MTTQTLVLLFICGLVFLIVGAEALVRGASRLAVAIGITPLAVGMTVVAYGTSAPEVAVTIQSMYSRPPQPDLAVGNVVGSNISNVLLVLGLASLAAPLLVPRTLVRITVPLMIAVSGAVWWMSFDGQIDRVEGLALLAGAVLFTVVSVARSRRAVAAAALERRREEPRPSVLTGVAATVGNLLLIILGLVLLVVGARWLVAGASEVARLLDVNELIVGLTVVAVGTSLPEIATSLVASIRGQRDIAVGNVVGSNIFNLLLVLGLAAALAPTPITVPDSALRFDIPIMFAVALACWPIFYSDWTISRWEGLAFLAFYAAYALFLYLKTTEHSNLDQYLTVMIYFVLPLTALVLAVVVVRQWRNGFPSADDPGPRKPD